MYEHVKTGCKHIPSSEQPLQFQSGYFLNKPRILFDGENHSFDASLVIYINSTNIPPIKITNRIYEHQNLTSLQLVSFLVRLRTYQHPCIYINSTNIPAIMIINRIYEHQNLLSLQLVSFLVRLRTYQHPCIRGHQTVLWQAVPCSVMDMTQCVARLRRTALYPVLPLLWAPGFCP